MLQDAKQRRHTSSSSSVRASPSLNPTEAGSTTSLPKRANESIPMRPTPMLFGPAQPSTVATAPPATVPTRSESASIPACALHAYGEQRMANCIGFLRMATWHTACRHGHDCPTENAGNSSPIFTRSRSNRRNRAPGKRPPTSPAVPSPQRPGTIQQRAICARVAAVDSLARLQTRTYNPASRAIPNNHADELLSSIGQYLKPRHHPWQHLIYKFY